MITVIAADGTIRYESPSVLTILGYDPDAMCGRNVIDYVYPEDRPIALAALARVIEQSNTVHTLELRFQHNNGMWLYLEVCGSNHITNPQIGGIIINSRDVTERKRDEERIRASARAAEALVRVAARLNAQLNSDTMLETICTETSRALHVSVAAVLLYDERREALYVAELFGLPRAILEQAQTIPHALFATMLQSQSQAPKVSSFDTQPGLPNYDLWRRLKVQSVFGAPMLREGRLIGVLCIGMLNEPRQFTPDDQELLQGLADQAALAIDNARLFADAERRLRQVRTLHTIEMAIASSLDLRVSLAVLLDQATTQLNVHAAAVLLFDPQSQTLEYAAGRGFRTNAITRSRLRSGEGIAGWAAFDRQMTGIVDLRARAADFKRSALLRDEAFVAYCAAPLITKGELKGVLEIFHRAPLDVDPEWIEFLTALAAQAAAIDNAELFDKLVRSKDELALAYDATIEGWSRALDLRDRETEGHSQRVTTMTLRLARAMGIADQQLGYIRWGALLHDIGKMGVPDRILLKPGSLDPDEWEIMRKHPVYAYEWLAPIAFLRPALEIPYCHHEKWDGSGYPRGIQGGQIPLSARIFAVADVWDALRSDRPYRAGWSDERARAHIQSQAGSHFDPDVVAAFLSLPPD